MTPSVAMATYNGARYLPAQLTSLAAQTLLPGELVACDDGSTDGTVAVLERFASDAPFPVRVFRNPVNLGSTGNFAQAIGRCTGDVIFLCDQDDLWHPHKLARFAATFDADPAVGLVASDLELVGPDGRELGRRVWGELPFPPALRAAVEAGGGPRLWVRYNTVTGAAAAFRADLREVILPIPPGWVHDAWVALVAAAFRPVRLIADPLTQYRAHAGQQIGSEPLTVRRQVRAARRMDAAYFAKVAACFAAAADRLEQFRDRLTDPTVVELLRGKAAFASAQRAMRDGSRAGRVAPALRQLLTGNYATYGRGLKGFAADLLL